MNDKQLRVDLFMTYLAPGVELCDEDRELSLAVIRFAPDDGSLLMKVVSPGDVPQINPAQQLSFRLTDCTGGVKYIEPECQAIVFEETTSRPGLLMSIYILLNGKLLVDDKWGSGI